MLRMKVLAASAITALSLVGCSPPETDRTVTGTDDLTGARATQVSADASQIARALDAAYATDGAYPTSPSAAGANTSPGNSVLAYQVVAVGFQFCVVNTETGAWASWASAKGGLVATGESDQTCTMG